MRVLQLVGLTLFGGMFASCAHAAMPKSEVLLADLNNVHGLKVARVSQADSYNNQPYITDSGVLYTHEVVRDDGTSQTEIAFYDFDSKQTKLLTDTAQSEYSPTLMPNGQAVSAIVVEQNGKQKLWQYPLEPDLQASRIFEWVEPVGYHAWGENADLIMFILGQPHTLQYTTLAAEKPQVMARDIGRSMLFDNENKRFLFSYYKEKQHWLASFDANKQTVKDILRLPDSVQDFTLKDKQTLIYAVKNRIYSRDLTNPTAISMWLDLSRFCETTISRLSYKDKKLAFVCHHS